MSDFYNVLFNLNEAVKDWVTIEGKPVFVGGPGAGGGSGGSSGIQQVTPLGTLENPAQTQGVSDKSRLAIGWKATEAPELEMNWDYMRGSVFGPPTYTTRIDNKRGTGYVTGYVSAVLGTNHTYRSYYLVTPIPSTVRGKNLIQQVDVGHFDSPVDAMKAVEYSLVDWK